VLADKVEARYATASRAALAARREVAGKRIEVKA
jgi:hypothetical protein